MSLASWQFVAGVRPFFSMLPALPSSPETMLGNGTGVLPFMACPPDARLPKNACMWSVLKLPGSSMGSSVVTSAL